MNNENKTTYLPKVQVIAPCGTEITLTFYTRPSGKYQKIIFGVIAFDEGAYGTYWDNRYNKLYDTKKQWLAAHARYVKKAETRTDRQENLIEKK